MLRFEEVLERCLEGPKIWVIGAEGTSELKCKVCDGWLNHWKKLAKVIGNVNCCHPDHEKSGAKVADRGAHVKKRETPENKTAIELSPTDIYDISSEKLFIIPVCEEHNITGTESILIPKKTLVNAKPCIQESMWQKAGISP